MTAGAAAVRFGGMKAGLQIPESVHVRIEIHILNGLDLLLSLLAVNCLLARNLSNPIYADTKGAWFQCQCLPALCGLSTQDIQSGFEESLLSAIVL